MFKEKGRKNQNSSFQNRTFHSYSIAYPILSRRQKRNPTAVKVAKVVSIQRPMTPPQPDTNTTDIVPWGRHHVAIALAIAYFLVPLLALYAESLLSHFFPLSPPLEPVHKIILHQGLTLLTWILILQRLQKKFACPLSQLFQFLGLHPTPPLRAYLKYSLWAMGGVLGVILLISRLSPSSTPLPSPYEGIPTEELQILIVFGVLMAPIVEEIVFRGFVQTTLYKYYHPALAILLTSLIFTLLHSMYLDSPLAMTSTLMMGTLLGYVRFKSRSLFPGMTAHLFNNILASIQLFNAL